MSSPQLYTRIDVFWNSVLLLEEATIEVTRKTNSQPISSVQKDYAGESPGAKDLEARVVSGIPVAGIELDPGGYEENLIPGVLELAMAGKVLRSRGFIVEDSIAGGVNQESKSNFTFRGEWASFK